MQFIFPIVFVTVFLIIIKFIRDNASLFGRKYSKFNWFLYVALFLTIVGTFLPRIYPKGEDIFLWRGVAWIGLFCFGFLFFLAVWVVFKQLFLSYLVKKNAPPENERRREFLEKSWLATLGFAATSTSAAAVGIAHGTPKVEHVILPIKNLPASFDGYKIAQLSDIHVGQTIRREFLEQLVTVTNSLSPDTIAVTGDLVDGFPEYLKPECEPFKTLKAQDGVFYVTGNHEYYWGALPWIEAARSFGWTPLINEHRKIVRTKDGKEEHIVMAGVTDLHAERFIKEHKSDPVKAMAGSDKNAFKIALAHQPKSYKDVEAAGFDLQLSGHTHAGQFFPATLFVYLFQPYVKGLHQFKNMWIYVNQGSGYWGPPMRMGTVPEITLIELRVA